MEAAAASRLSSSSGSAQAAWEAAWDPESKKWYFQERKTGRSSWERPPGCTVELPTEEPEFAKKPKDLPAGWEAAWDAPFQRFYFYNRETGARTWSKPKSSRSSALERVPPRPEASAATHAQPAHLSTSTKPRSHSIDRGGTYPSKPSTLLEHEVDELKHGQPARVPTLRRQRSSSDSSLPTLPGLPLSPVGKDLPDSVTSHAKLSGARPTDRPTLIASHRGQLARDEARHQRETRNRAATRIQAVQRGRVARTAPIRSRPAIPVQTGEQRSSASTIRGSRSPRPSGASGIPRPSTQKLLSSSEEGHAVSEQRLLAQQEAAAKTIQRNLRGIRHQRGKKSAADESASASGAQNQAPPTVAHSKARAKSKHRPHVSRMPAEPQTHLAHHQRGSATRASAASLQQHGPQDSIRAQSSTASAGSHARFSSDTPMSSFFSDVEEDASLAGTPASSSADKMSPPIRKRAKSEIPRKVSSSGKRFSSAHTAPHSSPIKGVPMPLPVDDLEAAGVYVEQACRMGCGRTPAPPFKGRVFDTCCRSCTRGAGHSKECDERAWKLNLGPKVTSGPLKRRPSTDQISEASKAVPLKRRPSVDQKSEASKAFPLRRRHSFDQDSEASSSTQTRSSRHSGIKELRPIPKAALQRRQGVSAAGNATAHQRGTSQRRASSVHHNANAAGPGISQRRASSVHHNPNAASPRRRTSLVQNPGALTSARRQSVQADGGQGDSILLHIPVAESTPRRARRRRRSFSHDSPSSEDGSWERKDQSSKGSRMRMRSPRASLKVPMVGASSSGTQRRSSLRLPSMESAVQRHSTRLRTAPSQPEAQEEASSPVAKRKVRRPRSTTDPAGHQVSRDCSPIFEASTESHSLGSRASRSPHVSGAGSSAQRRRKKSPELRIALNSAVQAKSATSSNSRASSRPPRRQRHAHHSHGVKKESRGDGGSTSHKEPLIARRLRQPRKSDPAVKTMLLVRSASKRLLQQAFFDARHEEDAEAARQVGIARLRIAFRDWRSYCATCRICSDEDSDGSSETESSELDSHISSELDVAVTRAPTLLSSSSSGSSSVASVTSPVSMARKEADEAIFHSLSPVYRQRGKAQIATPHGGFLPVQDLEEALETNPSDERHRGLVPSGVGGTHQGDAVAIDVFDADAATEELASMGSSVRLSVARKTLSLDKDYRVEENRKEKNLLRDAVAFWIGSSDLIKGLSVSVIIIYTVVGVLSFVIVLKLSEATVYA